MVGYILVIPMTYGNVLINIMKKHQHIPNQEVHINSYTMRLVLMGVTQGRENCILNLAEVSVISNRD
jgi:hypothetical protein